MADTILNLFTKSRYRPNVVCEEEEEYRQPFFELVDLLAPVRSLNGTAPGWPSRRFGLVLADLTDAVDALAAEWGWTDLLDPETREDRIKARHEAFFEAFEIPYYKAALTWDRVAGLSCPLKVSNLAEKWRDRLSDDGDDPSPQVAAKRFDQRRDAMMNAPRVGMVAPRFDDHIEGKPAQRIGMRLGEIQAALAEFVPPRQPPAASLTTGSGFTWVEGQSIGTLEAANGFRAGPLTEATRLEATSSRGPSAPSVEPESEQGRSRRSGTEEGLTPASKAIAAAYELQKEGKPVSVSAACRKAGVDRKNLRKRHHDVAQTIRKMAEADRSLPKGIRNRRTGELEAIDDGEE
jgi:hypothetical protein